MFRIETIELGRRMGDTAFFLHLTEPGVPLEVAYRVWLLRCGERCLVVDTGPPMEEGARRGLYATTELGAELRRRGVEPEEVEDVILTHLHWDHAANAGVFPRARFWVQASEVAFFRSRLREHQAVDRFFSHHRLLEELLEAGRMVLVDDDCELEPGLTALRVGGHTPGSQMLLVETDEGRCVLTGDAIPTHRNYLENIPSGILVDLGEAIGAIERVRNLDPVAIYTGHDKTSRLTLR